MISFTNHSAYLSNTILNIAFLKQPQSSRPPSPSTPTNTTTAQLTIALDPHRRSRESSRMDHNKRVIRRHGLQSPGPSLGDLDHVMPCQIKSPELQNETCATHTKATLGGMLGAGLCHLCHFVVILGPLAALKHNVMQTSSLADFFNSKFRATKSKTA